MLCDECSVKDQQPSALAACGVVLMLGHAQPGFQGGMFFRCLLGSKNGEIRLLGLLHLARTFSFLSRKGLFALLLVLEFKMPPFQSEISLPGGSFHLLRCIANRT